MKPSDTIAKEIDGLVDALNEATLPEPSRTIGRATAGFAEICAQWERFMMRVNTLAAAMTHPFAEGASQALQRADELVDDDVYRLSHRLRRVGEALAQRPTYR